MVWKSFDELRTKTITGNSWKWRSNTLLDLTL